jgi:hypothetical protein
VRRQHVLRHPCVPAGVLQLRSRRSVVGHERPDGDAPLVAKSPLPLRVAGVVCRVHRSQWGASQ